ncbi:MAG: hypothetical protein EOO13_12900, partial [Chitinophagaceae bacterium]
GGNRGGGGGMGGRGGGGNNFSVGQAAGISKTNALGVNFSNKYGPKLNLTASYFFNQSNINNNSARTEEVQADTSLFTEQQSQSYTKNYNHRFNMRLEYKIDSSNMIYFIPNVSFQGNNSSSMTNTQGYLETGDSTTNSNVMSDANRKGYNIRNNIMWRHNFAKRGRIFSLGFNTTHSRNTGEVIADGDYRFYKYSPIYSFEDSLQNRFNDNLTSTAAYGANFTYVEPIGKKGQLQFEYNPNIQKSKSDQQAFNFDGSKYSVFDSTFSNKFDNTITTHRGGITYRFQESRDAQFSIGLNAQSARLESDRTFPTVSKVDQSFFDFLPNAMYRKKFNAKNSVRLFYRANVNFPSVNQLQDVYDISNPLRVSVGNPGLKQSNTHFLGGGYTYTNSKKGNSLFINFFGQTANDYISNAIYTVRRDADSVLNSSLTLKKGSQLSKPVNLDGYRSLRSFVTYSMPLKFIKSNINLNAGISYSRLPGLIDYQETITDNVVYNAGVVVASNINEFVDFNVNYNVNFNNAKTTAKTTTDNNFVNQTAGATLNLLNKKGWFVQNDVINQSYTGLSAGFNQSYWLWNAAIGKKFLKNRVGELKLSVFDLLKQNQAISRTVENGIITDVQSLVLQQYFMLTFTYNLKNFGTPKRAANNDEDGPRNMGGGRPGGMGF